MKENYSFDEEEKRILSQKVESLSPSRRCVGLSATQPDIFGEEISVDMVFKQPILREIQEFSNDVSEAQKKSEGEILGVFDSWFHKLVVYPSLEYKKDLSSFLECHPSLILFFMNTLFAGASKPLKGSHQEEVNLNLSESIKVWRV